MTDDDVDHDEMFRILQRWEEKAAACKEQALARYDQLGDAGFEPETEAETPMMDLIAKVHADQGLPFPARERVAELEVQRLGRLPENVLPPVPLKSRLRWS